MSPSRRLRIAMISSNFGEYCIRLANAVSRHSDGMSLVPDPLLAPPAQKIESARRVFSFGNPRLRQPFHQFQAIRKVFRAIEVFAPDAVHYQGFHLWFDLALPLWHRYPLVCT